MCASHWVFSATCRAISYQSLTDSMSNPVIQFNLYKCPMHPKPSLRRILRHCGHEHCIQCASFVFQHQSNVTNSFLYNCMRLSFESHKHTSITNLIHLSAIVIALASHIASIYNKHKDLK